MTEQQGMTMEEAAREVKRLAEQLVAADKVVEGSDAFRYQEKYANRTPREITKNATRFFVFLYKQS